MPAVYRALEPKDNNNDLVSLVTGPWRHWGANHAGYDRNPQTFVDNIMYATPGGYRKATQSIWRGGSTSVR